MEYTVKKKEQGLDISIQMVGQFTPPRYPSGIHWGLNVLVFLWLIVDIASCGDGHVQIYYHEEHEDYGTLG